MKRALFASVVALLCACGSSGTNDNGGTGGNGGGGGTSGGSGADMSASAGNDLSMTLPADMQPAYGCNSLNNCIDGCSDQQCYVTCLASATMQARTLYNNAARCVRQACYPHADAGTPPCMNGGGTPSTECQTCNDDVLKMTGTCGADTQYCGSCYTQYQACLADKP